MRKNHRGGAGVVIVDRGNGKWLYRVWDAEAPNPTRPSGRGIYANRVFYRAEVDANRRIPGCAEGDAWAARKGAKFELDLDSAGKLLTRTVLKAYLESLDDRRRAPAHVADVRRIVEDLIVRGGVDDLRSDGLLLKVEAWRRSLRRRSRSVTIRRRSAKGRTVEAPTPLPVDPSKPAKMTEARLSPVTMNRYTVIVRALVNYAVKRQLLDRDPLAALELVSEPDQIKATFTVAEVRRFLAIHQVKDGAWWWVALMLLTGCRAREALHLKWEDVKDGVLLVKLREGVRIKREKERVIPLHPDLAEVLSWHPRRADIGWIIEDSHLRTMNTKCLGRRFADVLADAGIEICERTPHSCRHTLAAMLTAGHASAFMVADWLGHAQLETTRGYSREAAMLRPSILAEGWKPGELRLICNDSKQGATVLSD
jgi:integrase